MDSQFIRGLRWVLFVPTALIAAAAVGYIIGKPITKLIEGASDLASFLALGTTYANQGAAFVLAGAATAPRRQRDMG